MSDTNDPLAQIRDIIARYLDGATPYEKAVSELTAILGTPDPGEGTPGPNPPRARRIELQPFSLKQWMDLPKPSKPTFVASNLELAPGRTPREEARARELWIAAMKRLLKSKK